MKKTLTYLTKTLLVMGILFSAGMANAATFTAIASGNWTSNATWSGGIAPGTSLTADDIIIPSGYTVTMDNDIEFSGGLFASLNVDGNLESVSGSRLIMTSGDLSGSGDLTLEYLEFGAFSSMSFSGTANIEKMSNSGVNLTVAASIDVSDTLELQDGDLVLLTGANLNLNSNAVVKVNDGQMTTNGGLFGASNTYNVMYVGSSKTAGFETTGSGLANLTITLDDNSEVLSLGSDVEVNGDFSQESGDIDLDGNDLTLNGDFQTVAGAEFIGNDNSDLTINSTSMMTSDLSFMSGAERLNDLSFNGSSASSLALTTSLTVTGDLMIEEGDLIVASASTLSVSNGSTITVNNGDLMILSGSSFDGSADYDVEFMGNSNESGILLTGSGLNGVTLMLADNNESITLESDANVNGLLSLESGDLDMNGFNITLMGDFQSMNSAELQGDASSDLIIMSSSSINDTLLFDASSNELNALTIDFAGSGSATLGSDLTVETINLDNGVLVILDNDLTLNSTGSISGADEDNYISTEGSGSLMLTVNTSSPYVVYPVGTDEGFSPASIQTNNGTDGTFGVNASNGVMQFGSTGVDLAASESIVDRTWNVSYGTATSTDINLTVAWSASMEMNGFDNTDAQVSHFVNGNWDSDVSAVATTNASGMFEIERTGITSLSPFAVKDGESALSIEENTVDFGTFPNPTNGVLNVNLSDITGIVTIELIDGLGNVVKGFETKVDSSVETIDLTELPSGVYFIQVNTQDGIGRQRVVKS